MYIYLFFFVVFVLKSKRVTWQLMVYSYAGKKFRPGRPRGVSRHQHLRQTRPGQAVEEGRGDSSHPILEIPAN